MKKDIDFLKSMQILSKPLMVGFLIALVAIFAVLFWSFFGVIDVTINGRGILVSEFGLKDIQSPVKGTVNLINIKIGDIVNKGDLLLKIEDPELELKLIAAKKRLQNLQEDYQSLKDRISKEYSAEKKALQSKIKSTQFNIQELEKEINSLKTILDKHLKLLEEGLISQKYYLSEEQNIVIKKVDLESKKSELSDLLAQEQKEYRTQELIQKEQEVAKEAENLGLLQINLAESQIISPADGEILELKVAKGQLVNQGESLLWMEVKDEINASSPKILAYFPIQSGKKMQEGDRAQMTVKTVNENKFGGIEGRISQISPFAVSDKNIFNKIQNKTVVNYLMNSHPAVVEAIIDPYLDPNKPHRFLWSSGLQPDTLISNGTIGEVYAIVEKVRPIYYLLPLDKFKYPETEDP